MELVQEVEKIQYVAQEEEVSDDINIIEESRKSVSIVKIQTIICVILILSVISIKLFMPDLYEQTCNNIKSFTEKIFLYEDGDVNIIDE